MLDRAHDGNLLLGNSTRRCLHGTPAGHSGTRHKFLFLVSPSSCEGTRFSILPAHRVAEYLSLATRKPIPGNCVGGEESEGTPPWGLTRGSFLHHKRGYLTAVIAVPFVHACIRSALKRTLVLVSDAYTRRFRKCAYFHYRVIHS